MGDVIQFSGITRTDLDPDVVLENLKEKLEGFVLCGWGKDGEMFLSSTIADDAEINWLLDKCKQQLMEEY